MNLVVNKVRQFQDVHVPDSDGVVIGLACATIAKNGLTSLLDETLTIDTIWSDVFELACDTCNMLSRSNFWNAEDSPTFESPHQTRYIQQPVYLPNKVNLGQAWPTTVRHSPIHGMLPGQPILMLPRSAETNLARVQGCAISITSIRLNTPIK